MPVFTQMLNVEQLYVFMTLSFVGHSIMWPFGIHYEKMLPFLGIHQSNFNQLQD